MFKFGYIIPIHEKNELVFRALKSAMQFEDTLICISTNKKIADWIDENKGDLQFEQVAYSTNEDTSYPHLVNMGIESLKDKVEFISILEFDDVVSSTAHDAIVPYLENMEAHIYLPLGAMVTEDSSIEENKFTMVAMLNEAPFAAGVADEYGVLDFNMLLKANFAFVNGAYFKPEAFEKWGKFKENFKYLSDYELILRHVYEGAEIKSVPKLARFHYKREEGAFEQQKKLSHEDREYWVTTAKKEYMFQEDRELKK